MYLQALIPLSVIGTTLALLNLLYMFLQKRKYNATKDVARLKNGKGNRAKSMKDINNQVRSRFIKTILKTKMMQLLLVIDGAFFTTILVLIAVFIWM